MSRHYSISQLEELAAGQGGAPESSQHPEGSETSHLLSLKSNIHRDIYLAMMAAGEGIHEGWYRRAEIAKLVGLKKTPHITDAVEALVNEGYFVRYVQQPDVGLPTYWYKVK